MAQVTKEAHLVRHCKEYLTIQKRQKFLTFRRINIAPIPRGKGAMGLKRFSKNTDMVGMADFMLFFPHGITAHIECKAKKGKLSPHQKTWKDELKSLGHLYYVIYDVSELEKICKEVAAAITNSSAEACYPFGSL